MKELLHFTHYGSAGCISMLPVIEKLLLDNPEIIYTKIDVSEDPATYEYYSRAYALPAVFPAFIGLVDNKLQDGHIGTATQLILESLVN